MRNNVRLSRLPRAALANPSVPQEGRRAIGPSRFGFGISNPLADPVLELRAADGSLITSNDNWTSDRAAIEATGLQPSEGLEPAIVATLNPGSYTANMSGNNGGNGGRISRAYDLAPDVASELATLAPAASLTPLTTS